MKYQGHKYLKLIFLISQQNFFLPGQSNQTQIQPLQAYQSLQFFQQQQSSQQNMLGHFNTNNPSHNQQQYFQQNQQPTASNFSNGMIDTSQQNVLAPFNTNNNFSNSHPVYSNHKAAENDFGNLIGGTSLNSFNMGMKYI